MVLYEIVYAPNEVWINNNSGTRLGRFGKMGVDVYRSAKKQLWGDTDTAYCSHSKTTKADWLRFRQEMRNYHKINVAPEPIPAWL